MFDARFLRALLALILGYTALWVWRTTYAHTCLSLFIPLAVILIVTLNLREYAVRRRRCLAECYFSEKSVFYSIFNSRVMVTIFASFWALLTGAALTLNFLIWDYASLAVLFFDVFLILVLYIFIRKRLNPTLAKDAAPVIVKRWVAGINTIIVLLALVCLQYHSNFPSYLENTLTATVERASHDVGSTCPLIDKLARFQMEKEAYGWWIMAKVTRNMGELSNYKWIVWILFLLNGSLNIWAYSRYLIQLAHYAYRMGEDNV